MAQILNFDEAVGSDVLQRCGGDLKVVRREQPEEADDFWPEVSCSRMDEPIAVNPANSQGRVLTEMLAILGGTGLLVALASFLSGTSYP
ncbi:MAG TPA: hypothetical protein VG889_01745 [Rhizomicrobium sp.]|nr:hypothetical protein [Rhizomicrobium sp.]